MKARTAYFRAEGKAAPQPNEGMSGAVEHDGNDYVRLANCNGMLAVYEVNGNRLKRLKQWPEALEAA